jgi:hypothetical protein
MWRVRATLIVSALALGFGSCGHGEPECLALPCAIPLAIQMSVTSGRGGPVADVAVTISGAVTGAASCNTDPTATVCYVAGVAGTYELEITARGFQTSRRTVTVSGTTPECGCPAATTVRLDVVLDPVA